MGLGGGDNREDTCGADVITGDEGIEEVFAIGEAALEIEVVFEVEVPGRSGFHIEGLVRKIHWAERRVGRQGDDAGSVTFVRGNQRVVAAVARREGPQSRPGRHAAVWVRVRDTCIPR